MKRNKGFTLIELLAVIVILAVITLIATPIVIGLIENSQNSAFKSSLYGIFDAAEYKLVQDKNTQFPSEGIDVHNLSMNNNRFISGTVLQDEKGMYLENVTDGKYCGNGYKDELKATKGNCQTDAKWFTFDKNTGTITGYSNEGPKSVIIPETIDNAIVRTIGSRAFAYFDLTSISIPNTVTKIESAAFLGNLLPDSQSFIYNRNADGSENKTNLNSYGGSKRENIQIPESVQIIGESAFSCLNLNGTSSGLISIVIPDNVIEIQSSAFDSNYDLTNVTLSNNLKVIGYMAFGFDKLENIVIPDSVVTIGDWAFGQNQLTTISIPNSVKTIGENAFYNNQLTKVILEEGINTIGVGAFSVNKLTNIVIPNSVTTIGDNAFSINQLTSITIPKNVISIGSGAFIINKLASVKIIGKSSSNAFTKYGTTIWGWASGYNDSNITWNASE